MLNKLLEKNVQVATRAENWEQAVALAARPLLKQKIIEERYVQAMIRLIHELGFYVVLADGIAMPHARPEDGVNEVGLALLKLDEPVLFGEKPVQLIFVLAAKDNKSHLEVITELAELFDRPLTLEKMMGCLDEQTLLATIRGEK